jgi:hypothetical protein
VEFGVSLSRSTTDKYKQTAALVVYSENFDEMSNFFTAQIPQGDNAKLAKKETTDKNMRSVQLITTYKVTAGTSYVTKQYLYAVGDKTYSLETINEELNAQIDPNYAADFDKLYESLRLN